MKIMSTEVYILQIIMCTPHTSWFFHMRGVAKVFVDLLKKFHTQKRKINTKNKNVWNWNSIKSIAKALFCCHQMLRKSKCGNFHQNDVIMTENYIISVNKTVIISCHSRLVANLGPNWSKMKCIFVRFIEKLKGNPTVVLSCDSVYI